MLTRGQLFFKKETIFSDTVSGVFFSFGVSCWCTVWKRREFAGLLETADIQTLLVRQVPGDCEL